jgi:hypothetical protein
VIVHLETSNFALCTVHPQTVQLDKHLWDKMSLLDPFPLSKCARFFSCIIRVKPILGDSVLMDDVVKYITTIGLAVHEFYGGPSLIVAE